MSTKVIPGRCQHMLINKVLRFISNMYIYSHKDESRCSHVYFAQYKIPLLLPVHLVSLVPIVIITLACSQLDGAVRREVYQC
jgi:hypothetical protein